MTQVVAAFTVEPARRVFIGFDPTTGERLWTGQARDAVGIVGPPGYGKSSGVIIPALMAWNGPAVATSTRADLLRFTGDQRTRIARSGSGRAAGRVYVYDPFGSEPDLAGVGWSPLQDCANPAVAYRRVHAMTATAAQGVTNADHWRQGAARILRGYFHAAALAGFTLSTVRRWLARQDTEEPVALLNADDRAAAGWADDLVGLRQVGERERGSFFSTAMGVLDATVEPAVAASCDAASLDIDEFLATSSTLFVVGPSHYQDVVAPLVVGLVDAIAQRAAELAARQRGVLDPPLLLALDEVANIAPLRSLPALVSEGGGRGITTLWAVQSLAQLRERYGRDAQQAILSATTGKLIFGGLSNGEDLRDISSWAGEYREMQTTLYLGGDAFTSPAQPGRLTSEPGRQHAIGGLYRPVLPVQAIQQLPPLNAWLFYRSDPPLMVATPPAGTLAAYDGLAGYTPGGPA